MVAINFLFTGLIGVASAVGMQADEVVFATLLKRQAPGTPSYNCHDNCGQAITLSKRPDPCSNDAFKTNYNNCLQCSGPDNYNIWRMYGNTLSSAGSSCGLSTTPLSGKQPDVGPAVQAGSSSGTIPAGTSMITMTSPALATTTPSSLSFPSSVTSSAASILPVSRNSTASATGSTPPQQSANVGIDLEAGVCGMVVAVLLGATFGM